MKFLIFDLRPESPGIRYTNFIGQHLIALSNQGLIQIANVNEKIQHVFDTHWIPLKEFNAK